MEFIGRSLLASPNPNARAVARQPGRGVVVVPASEEWKAWIESLARYSRLDVAKLIDRAVIEFAKREGFEPEAPER